MRWLVALVVSTIILVGTTEANILTGSIWPGVFVLFVSAAWAANDSWRLQLHKYRRGSMGPVVVFFGVLLAWVILFPLYLVRRSQCAAGELPLKDQYKQGSGATSVIDSTISLKTLLKPIASLQLTVALLLISMVLVLAGTTAQRDMGVQDVLSHFFHAKVYSKIFLHYFEPTPKAGHDYRTGNWWFPLPGGYVLIGLLLANLLSAHAVRFKFNRRRIGIILIHFGLILLLVGEVVTGFYAVESHMRIDVDGSANYSADMRDGHAQLALIDPSSPDHDHVITVPQNLLEKSANTHQPIHDPNLPVDVKVEAWYDNASLRGPRETGSDVERKATAGADQSFGLNARRQIQRHRRRSDIPAAFVTLSKNGQSLGTYLLTARFDPVLGEDPNDMLRGHKPQEVTLDGKPYQVVLRFERYYKPYTVYLSKFTHDRFLGTNVPKDFASDVRLDDPVHHVNRTARIWMNHPLRYLPTGETFYQADFDHAQDRYTILQVVHNPGWLMPYFACAIGALGLLIHFGTNLVSFLRRRAKSAMDVTMAPLPPPLPGHAIPVGNSGRRFAKTSSSRSSNGAGDTTRYTLAPRSRLPGLIFPGIVLVVALLYVLSRLLQPAPVSTTFNWSAFGRLPVQFEGRTQPLTSLATNSIKIVSGRQTPHDANGKACPPEQWLLDVMTRNSRKFEEYKVIRIDHPQIKDLLGLPDSEKLFSWADIFKNEKNFAKIDEQANLAADKSSKDRESYDNQILDLKEHLDIYLRLFQVDAILARYEFVRDPERVKQVYGPVVEAISRNDPDFVARMHSVPPQQMDRLLRQALGGLDFGSLTPTEKEALIEWKELSDRTQLLTQMNAGIDLFVAAPDSSNGQWKALRSAITEPRADVPKSAEAFLKIIRDYEDNHADDFNADVAAYTTRLDTNLPSVMTKIDTELFFNRFDVFTICMAFYVTVFVLTLISWLVRNRSVALAGLWLLAFTLTLHSAGLVLRIYISAPPVTNLYSSAVFIAWGIVLFSVFLEAIFRNGLAQAMASVAGFASLLVAAGLASTEGDTMKQLQAVLDTNFWLATHVVCVTLGYTATFLAGVLAIGYVLASPAAALLRLASKTVGSSDDSVRMTPDSLKEISRMVYGIVCFAMLFSFVGTILGGIWADQSWGRFWGWDPKENGAVLIVLWNALILHARWGGVVRERGMMVLAILGNIVTSWSWFGTNMLGIGLHSYGFMESAQFALIAFMLSQLLVAAFGLIPQGFWASVAGSSGRIEPKRPMPVG